MNESKSAFHHKNLVVTDVCVNLALDWAIGENNFQKTHNEDL